MLTPGILGWIGIALAVVGFVLWPLTARLLGWVFRPAAIGGLVLIVYGLLLQ